MSNGFDRMVRVTWEVDDNVETFLPLEGSRTFSPIDEYPSTITPEQAVWCISLYPESNKEHKEIRRLWNKNNLYVYVTIEEVLCHGRKRY